MSAIDKIRRGLEIGMSCGDHDLLVYSILELDERLRKLEAALAPAPSRPTNPFAVVDPAWIRFEQRVAEGREATGLGAEGRGARRIDEAAALDRRARDAADLDESETTIVNRGQVDGP